jgi:hypothetical protein
MIILFNNEIASLATTAFQFDAELEETRTSPAESTDYAADSGATMSDYVVIKPEEYRFSGYVVRTPIVSSPTLPWDESPGVQRIIDAYNALITLRNKRQPVQIALRYWSPIVWITECEAKTNQETGDAIEVSIACKEVRKATPSVAMMPKLRPISARPKNVNTSWKDPKTGAAPTSKADADKVARQASAATSSENRLR